MRLAAIILAAVMATGSVSFASPKADGKKFHKMCKEENPGASRADLKKCVKTKVQEAKAAK